MRPVSTRHGFLARLHEELRPDGYLEIGVQYGRSFNLVRPHTKVAIGVDPRPMIDSPNIEKLTSDEYFANHEPTQWVDLAFIDGMHLVEFALRDFIGVEACCKPGAVVVFDDVLPYSWDIAGRTPLIGDWTGDVWKVHQILREWRPDLTLTLVDVEPTGVLVIQGLDSTNTTLSENYGKLFNTWARETPKDESVISRSDAMSPNDALTAILGGSGVFLERQA